MKTKADASYFRRVQNAADLLRAMGRSEEQVNEFIQKATARRDRRMLAYYARRYIGFWKDVFGSELQDDIIERTQTLYDYLVARMYSVYDEASGAHVLALPRAMRLTKYHYIPFDARGYKRVRLNPKRGGAARLLVRPMNEIVEDVLNLARIMRCDERNADMLRYLLSIADADGRFSLEPRYYDGFDWDPRYARRYAHFALMRLRREGYVVMLEPGRFNRRRSLNQLLSPALIRFALDVHVAIRRASEETEEEERDESRDERGDREEIRELASVA